MTSTQFASLIRYKTKTDSTTFPDAEILVLANVYKDELASRIQERRPDFWNVTTSYNLSNDTRTIDVPASLLTRIVYVEADFDNNADFDLLTPVQRLQWREGLDEAQIIADWDGVPSYYLKGNKLH